MTSALDSELSAAFESTTEFVQPPPDLADRVRREVRRRRRWLTVSIASATAAVAIVAGGGFLAAHDLHRAGKHASPPTGGDHEFSLTLPAGDTAQQLATAGSYLYVLIGPPDGEGATLAAYDRSTGRLVHEISVPGAGGSALAVGPGGLVWLSFDASTSAGPSGTWLLSPDLQRHSTAPGGDTYALLPVSQTTALIPGQYGLTLVRIAPPGGHRRATEHLEQRTSLGPPMNTAPGTSAAVLNGRVVVQVTNGYGLHSHLVIAGHPHVTFGGRDSEQAGYVASDGDSLWLQTFAVHGPLEAQYATGFGQLMRLNSRLQPTTPNAVLDSPVLARTVQVWASAGTVWAATAARGHPLVCFADDSQPGPVTTLPLRGPVTALAAAGNAVYVTTTPADAASGTVTSYPVPAACR